ncbi:hypothetical protein HanPI659440_Chr15g0616821 [Helianthus annuus]|nr:hypothetical protein HanPI659440_Chr15g0616821 [Helianthus annuus]
MLVSVKLSYAGNMQQQLRTFCSYGGVVRRDGEGKGPLRDATGSIILKNLYFICICNANPFRPFLNAYILSMINSIHVLGKVGMYVCMYLCR